MGRAGKGRSHATGAATGTQKVGAGRLRGRRLLALPREIEGVRPTGSRVRSAIFDRLQAEVVGARVLDPFAGTGALAIEAVSRGAARAVCIERAHDVADFLRRQVSALELEALIDVIGTDAVGWLRAGPGEGAVNGPFSLVLVDPPYARRDLYEAVLDALAPGDAVSPWLAPGAVAASVRSAVAPVAHALATL